MKTLGHSHLIVAISYNSGTIRLAVCNETVAETWRRRKKAHRKKLVLCPLATLMQAEICERSRDFAQTFTNPKLFRNTRYTNRYTDSKQSENLEKTAVEKSRKRRGKTAEGEKEARCAMMTGGKRRARARTNGRAQKEKTDTQPPRQNSH